MARAETDDGPVRSAARLFLLVIPATAGIQPRQITAPMASNEAVWIPACAGMAREWLMAAVEEQRCLLPARPQIRRSAPEILPQRRPVRFGQLAEFRHAGRRQRAVAHHPVECLGRL